MTAATVCCSLGLRLRNTLLSVSCETPDSTATLPQPCSTGTLCKVTMQQCSLTSLYLMSKLVLVNHPERGGATARDVLKCLWEGRGCGGRGQGQRRCYNLRRRVLFVVEERIFISRHCKLWRRAEPGLVGNYSRAGRAGT